MMGGGYYDLYLIEVKGLPEMPSQCHTRPNLDQGFLEGFNLRKENERRAEWHEKTNTL